MSLPPVHRTQLKNYRSLFWLFGLLVVVGCGTYLITSTMGADKQAPLPVEDPSAHWPRLIDSAVARGCREYRGEIERGMPFSGSLLDAGIPAQTTQQICSLLESIGFDFRNCKPRQPFIAQMDSSGKLARFRFEVDVARSYWIRPDSSNTLHAELFTKPITEELISVEGQVESSVYNAIIALGEKPELIAAYADVLGYDIDFIFDPRFGDRFRMLVLRQKLDGNIIGYGRLLAAEYSGSETGDVHAYWFSDSLGKAKGWYAKDGRNVQRAFMRSPLSILRVTSTFGMRTHPISGRWKMHTGMDYGAPTGTPVWSVASGVVTHAGRRGGYGNLVEISHPGGIKTRYAHLSRILVRRGQAVRQQQTIGKVGSTGYSTAPHLHFEFLVNGRHTVQRKVKNPPLKRIPDQFLPQFKAAVDRIEEKWREAKTVRATSLAARTQ